MVSHVVKTGLGLLCLVGAGAITAATPQSTPLLVQCTATGTKFFAPAMSAPEVCARFGRALAAAHPTPVSSGRGEPGDRLVVQLLFQAHGVASVTAIYLHLGSITPLPVYELATSDRHFSASDIDRLASDVARGLKMGKAQKGPG